jgi:hypothetical protein
MAYIFNLKLFTQLLNFVAFCNVIIKCCINKASNTVKYQPSNPQINSLAKICNIMSMYLLHGTMFYLLHTTLLQGPCHTDHVMQTIKDSSSC